MTKKDYELIAREIWRAGYVADKNKVRQEAREAMRRLITINIARELKADNPRFDSLIFSKACGYNFDILA
jgi:hypothetical protein